MRLAVGCLVVLFLSACGPSLTMGGARAKLVNKDELESECRPIGEVEGRADSEKDAIILMRNKAGELSSDRVVVVDTVENAGEVTLVGKAYGCRTLADHSAEPSRLEVE